MKNYKNSPRFFNILVVFIFVVLLDACSSGEEGGGTQTPDADLIAMTFNIRIGAGTIEYTLNPYYNMLPSDLRNLPNIDQIIDDNLPAIVESIQSVNPDIIGLQEVNGDSQAAALASALGMNYEFTAHNGNPNSRSGLALLTPYDIVSIDTRVISLNIDTGNERRIQIITLDIDGRMVTVINLHIDFRLDDGSSELNIATAIDDFNADIALGDYNATPSEPVLAPIKDRMIDTTTALGLPELMTSPGRNKQIDYIFIENNIFTPVSGGLFPSQYRWVVSDHNAVYAGLNFR